MIKTPHSLAEMFKPDSASTDAALSPDYVHGQTLVDGSNSRCISVPMLPGEAGFEDAYMQQFVQTGRETVALDTTAMPLLLAEGTRFIDGQPIPIEASFGVGVIACLKVVVPNGTDDPAYASRITTKALQEDLDADRVRELSPLFVGVAGHRNLETVVGGLLNNSHFADGSDGSRRETLEQLMAMARQEADGENGSGIRSVMIGDQSFFDPNTPSGWGVTLATPTADEVLRMHGVRYDPDVEHPIIQPIGRDELPIIAEDRADYQLYLGLDADGVLFVDGRNSFDPKYGEYPLPSVIVEAQEVVEPIEFHPMALLLAHYIDHEGSSNTAEVITVDEPDDKGELKHSPQTPLEPPDDTHMADETGVDSSVAVPIDAGEHKIASTFPFERFTATGFTAIKPPEPRNGRLPRAARKVTDVAKRVQRVRVR
ncbi:MAG: hypothetical protein V4702_02415 [Patescibacteria group bacterium]